MFKNVKENVTYFTNINKVTKEKQKYVYHVNRLHSKMDRFSKKYTLPQQKKNKM